MSKLVKTSVLALAFCLTLTAGARSTTHRGDVGPAIISNIEHDLAVQYPRFGVKAVTRGDAGNEPEQLAVICRDNRFETVLMPIIDWTYTYTRTQVWMTLRAYTCAGVPIYSQTLDKREARRIQSPADEVHQVLAMASDLLKQEEAKFNVFLERSPQAR